MNGQSIRAYEDELRDWRQNPTRAARPMPKKVSAYADGIPCPHGCSGTAWRMFGLVSHLMGRHGYTEKAAWRKAHARMRG
jgi:hypothetical protein